MANLTMMNEQPSVDRRTVARVTLAFVAAYAIAAAACVEVEPDFEDQLAVRDSLGVEIVETDGQQARAPSSVTVRSEPELQIGVLDGDPAYLFSGITGVALLPGSRILVVDGGSGELRFYDLQGGFISQKGGIGEGPGEFRWPVFRHTTAGDSLVILEGTTGTRITVYSSDGGGFHTFNLDYNTRGPQGMSGDRILIVRGGGPTPRDVEGLFTTTENVLIVDLRLETVDTIATRPYVNVVVRRSAGGRSIASPLFAFRTAVAFGDDGFFITTPDEPSVLEYSWAGELRRIIRLLEPRNEVTDAEFRAALERRVESRNPDSRSAFRRVFDELEPPEAEPTFQSLIVDAEGWLWAQTYQENFAATSFGAPLQDKASTWLLFDPDGRGRGSAVMPEGLSVHDISRDFVAGVWEDEFEVEYVRLYRIDGRP